MLFCKKNITSSNDLKSGGTEGCLFQICSSTDCHHFFDNKYYCNDCFTVNQSIHNDTSERIFSGSNNDDCVTVFGNNEGDEDIQSVAHTLRSMSDITLFDRSPDWVVPEPEHLDSVMRLVECLLLPTQTDNSNDNNESFASQISDVFVDEYIKQYLMKGGICILKKSTIKIFDYSKEFYSRDLLESMNEKWKSQVMISFSIYRKIKMNGFIDWNLWIKKSSSFEVVNKYTGLIYDEDRNDKTEFFNSLYLNEFIKLNVKHFLC